MNELVKLRVAQANGMNASAHWLLLRLRALAVLR